MAADLTDVAEIVAAAQSRDRVAFGMLYERFWKLVHGVLLANADRDDVADLIQEVFFTAMRRIHTLKDRAAFGAWVAAIARNEARMLQRGKGHMVPVPEEMTSATRTDDRLNASEVIRAVRSLPEKYRECLLLRLVDEMTGEEIAEHLGLSHGTVRVYMHHGFARLREALGESNGR